MSKFLKILLYPVVFFLSLVLFSVLLFPFDSVKNRAATEIENAMGGGYQVTIGKLSPSLPSGAVLKDIEIRPRGSAAAAPMKLSQAKVKVGLLALLSGGLEVDFDVKPPQGRATGAFIRKGGGMEIEAKLDRFDLGLISFLTQRAGIPVTGTVSGNVSLEMYPQDPLRNTGSAVLQVLDLGLGEISLAEGAFKVPAMKLAQTGGNSKIDIQVSRGNLEVKSLQLAGGDLDLNTDGKVYGARRADNYRFNLKGSFKPTPDFAQKFQILGLVEKQKAADGSYPFTITGRVSKPSIRIGEFKLPI
ncbi:MAG TPA: type II secretion system protein GspN [bacterium]|nr:type II secretion system protein GspN [bacterium]